MKVYLFSLHKIEAGHAAGYTVSLFDNALVSSSIIWLPSALSRSVHCLVFLIIAFIIYLMAGTHHFYLLLPFLSDLPRLSVVAVCTGALC